MREIQLLTDVNAESQVAESFKTLRANLQFCGPKYKVILVTSCLQSDGKTTVTYQIASSFAADGKKVLLLDTDLRKSVMSKRLCGQSHLFGTTEILSGKLSYSDCVCKTQFPNLDILFSGAVPPNPAELLGSQEFGKLVDQMRELYDIIIVDTPPLGAVIDAAIVAKVCDGSVLVICANAISRHFAINVLEQLKKSGCPVLGAVLNRVVIHSSRYYKGSYYRYGKYYKKYYRYGYGKGEYGYGYSYDNEKKKGAKK